MAVPVDLSKLSDVVKKAVYDQLGTKVNNIDNSVFVLKTKYQTDKAELEKKIPDVTDFFKKTKLTELENKIRDVSYSATTNALNAVGNRIPSVSSLVKKKQIITQKLLKLKKNLLVMVMINILLLQSLIF